MKIATKHERIERKNSDVCSVTEYPMIDEAVDFAIVKVTGRYPENKQAVNQKCKEIVYIHAGTGKAVVDGKEYALEAGDLVLIEAGEKFYWQGTLELFISCRPSFSVDQHQIVD
jgi:mannose-6-phosphate isomerase-like protein (cupin superfamily)